MRKILLALAFMLLSGYAFAQGLADWQNGCVPYMGGDNKFHCDQANFGWDAINTQIQFQNSNVTSTVAEMNTAFDLTDNNETLIATTTLTSADCGKVLILSAATEFATTLPAVTAGCKFKFIVGAAPSGASYTVVTPASANLLIGGINELAVVTTSDMPYVSAGDTITFTNGVSVVGDWVYMVSDGTSWYIRGEAKAATGAEPTQAS